jgi:hyperosmotically inducible periplasmic protein
MKTTMLALAVVALAGCSKNESTDTPSTAADNTARNERDQRGDMPTPGAQGENEADRTITQQIRQQVVKGDDISLNGKNVKIVTVDGVVTLRGPVETAAERSTIASVAKSVDGVKRVDNQLEIAAK